MASFGGRESYTQFTDCACSHDGIELQATIKNNSRDRKLGLESYFQLPLLAELKEFVEDEGEERSGDGEGEFKRRAILQIKATSRTHLARASDILPLTQQLRSTSGDHHRFA